MPRLPVLFCTGAVMLGSAIANTASAAQQQYPYSLTLYEQADYRGASVTIYGDNANLGSTGFTTRARSAQIRGTWRICEGGGYRLRCEVLSDNIRDLDTYGLAGKVGSAQSLNPPNIPASGPQSPWPAPVPEATAAAPGFPPAPAASPYRAPPASAAAPAARPAYPEQRAARSYEPVAEPPAVDAPIAGPGRFGRAGEAVPPAPPPARTPTRTPAPARAPVAATYGAPDARGMGAIFFASPTAGGGEIAAFTPRAADAFCQAQGLAGAIYFDQSRNSPRAVDLDGRSLGEGPVLRDVLCRR